MIKVQLESGLHILKISHRYDDFEQPLKQGGWASIRIPVETTAVLYPDGEPEMALEDCAMLHPADNPNKAIGRKIALERVAAKLESKADRAALWTAVRNSGMKFPGAK